MKLLQNLSIQKKLAVFPLISVVSLLVLGAVIYHIGKNAMTNALVKPMVKHAETLSRQVDGIIAERNVDLYVWSNNLGIKSALSVNYGYEEISSILTNWLKMKEYFIYLAVADKNGLIVAGTEKAFINTRCSQAPWFATARQKEGYISNLQEKEKSFLLNKLPDNANVYTMELAFPVIAENGQFLGVIHGALDWHKISQEMMDNIKTYYESMRILSGYAFILRADDVIIAHPNPKILGKRPGDFGLGPVFAAVYQEPFGVINYTWERKDKTAGFAASSWAQDYKENPILVHGYVGFVTTKGAKDYKGFGWKYLVGANDEEIFRTGREIGMAILVITILVMSLILLCSFLVARNIVKPVEGLMVETHKIAAGDYDARVSITGSDEMGRLAQAFNNMVDKVQDYSQNLENLVKARTAELEKAYDEIKKLDEMKSTFLSTVSHELRTPLTSVLGFTKIIKNRFDGVLLPLIHTEDKKTQKIIGQVNDNLNIIIAEGERLTTLINDVLDLAKMEAGKIEWKNEPLNINEVLERATASTLSLFEHKDLVLVKKLDRGLPEATGDKDRLIQVVINLISNAVKFSDCGSITCKSERLPKEIMVSVQDCGVGIAPEDQPKVFEKFKQVGDTLTDRPKGTGLGLPICKQIIEHHGGRIGVESRPGQGSTFFFTLPLPVEEEPALKVVDWDTLVRQLKEHMATAVPSSSPGASPAEEHAKKTILVVDDDAGIRQLLRQELENTGYRVKEAADGPEGLKQVEAERPDLIILDVMMPGMSGFDVAATLKNDPVTMDIPIIILSVLEDKSQGYRLGVDRYLTKPLNTEELFKAVEDLLSRGASPRKVLVVDEDQSTARTLTEALEAKGYHVASVGDGEECIQKALKEKPDMIIVDAMVSNRDKMVKALRFEKELENVYFILLGKPQAGVRDS